MRRIDDTNFRRLTRVQLRHRVLRAEDEAEMSWGCLMMVKDALTAFGVDMKATPPMFYDNALAFAVLSRNQRIAELEAQVASLTPTPKETP